MFRILINIIRERLRNSLDDSIYKHMNSFETISRCYVTSLKDIKNTVVMIDDDAPPS